MPTAVLIDGALVPPEQARVSVFDRGFLYGDAAFEVLRTYRGEAFGVEEHVGRLQRSARALAITVPASVGQFRAEIDRAVEAAANEESYVRVVLTRGASSTAGVHPPAGLVPTRVVIAQPLAIPERSLYADGARALIVPIPRAGPDALAAAKTANYLTSVLATRLARARGAHEALMRSADGKLLEGATSNVFAIEGTTLRTPPADGSILAGVTRERVLDLAAACGLTAREAPMTEADLWTADEVFLTSSVREVLPIVRIDDHEVGEGTPGPRTRSIHRALRARTPLGPASRMPWE